MASRNAIRFESWLESTLWCIVIVNVLFVKQRTKSFMQKQSTSTFTITLHFVGEILEEGKILLQKVHTEENPTNMMTKVMSIVKFKHCLDLINILHD